MMAASVVASPAITPSSVGTDQSFTLAPAPSSSSTSSVAVTSAQAGAVGGALGGGAADAANAVAGLQGILSALQSLVQRLSMLITGAGSTQPVSGGGTVPPPPPAKGDTPGQTSPIQVGATVNPGQVSPEDALNRAFLGEMAVHNLSALVAAKKARISDVRAQLAIFSNSTGTTNQMALQKLQQESEAANMLQHLADRLVPHAAHLTADQITKLNTIIGHTNSTGDVNYVAINDLLMSVEA